MAAVGAQRDAPARRLEPDQAAARGRDPDRAAAVVAVGDRHHARGHRRRRAAAGAAGRAVERPRVARGAEAARLGGRQDPLSRAASVLPTITNPASRSRRTRNASWSAHEVAEQVAAHRHRHPGDGPVVLDRDRHAGERARIARARSPSRGGQRGLGGDVRERVDRRLQLVDPAQRASTSSRALSSPARTSAASSTAERVSQVGHDGGSPTRPAGEH